MGLGESSPFWSHEMAGLPRAGQYRLTVLLALTVTSSTSATVSPRITGGAGGREKRVRRQPPLGKESCVGAGAGDRGALVPGAGWGSLSPAHQALLSPETAKESSSQRGL